MAGELIARRMERQAGTAGADKPMRHTRARPTNQDQACMRGSTETATPTR
jgi:hypothetical protein